MADTTNDKTDDQVNVAFAQLLIAEQFKMLRYIAMLLGDPHAANYVLQETNLVLWQKSKDFEIGTNFSAWAKKVAYWQVQAYVRDRKRDRHVFSKELVEQLAIREDVNPQEENEVELRVALRHCLGHVSQGNLQMLQSRYGEGLPIASIAERFDRSKSAIKVTLYRIRQVLMNCIEKKRAEGLSDA